MDWCPRNTPRKDKPDPTHKSGVLPLPDWTVRLGWSIPSDPSDEEKPKDEGEPDDHNHI